MSNALDILAQQFEKYVAPSRELRSGVYLLIKDNEIIYVGSTVSIDVRVDAHATWSDKNASKKTFDSVLWFPLPIDVAFHYEGALIRALKPRLNFFAPKHWRYDNVILEGLGLPKHADQKQNWIDWKDQARPRRQRRSDFGRRRASHKSRAA